MSTNEEHDDGSLVRSVLGLLKERFEILSKARDRSSSGTEREATNLSAQAGRVVHPLVASSQVLVKLLPKAFSSEPVDTLDGAEIEFYDKWWVAVVAGLANRAATTDVSPNRSIRQTLDNCSWQYQHDRGIHWALPSWRDNRAFWPLFCEVSCSAIDSCLSSLRSDFVLDPDTQKAMSVMEACLSGPVADSTQPACPEESHLIRKAMPTPASPASKRTFSKKIEMKGKARIVADEIEAEMVNRTGRSLTDILKSCDISHETYRKSANFAEARLTWDSLESARAVDQHRRSEQTEDRDFDCESECDSESEF